MEDTFRKEIWEINIMPKLSSVDNFVSTFHGFKERHLPYCENPRCKVCKLWLDILVDPQNQAIIKRSGVARKETLETSEQLFKKVK